MNIIVESQEAYDKWLAEQSTFTSSETAELRNQINEQLAQN